MGVFSPVVSVVAALRVNPLEVVSPEQKFTISNLPARTVELGSTAATVIVPTINNNGEVVLCHAGKESDIFDEEGNYTDTFKDGKYTYREVGQYEWRFYTDNTKNVLFDTYTVTVTDTSYSMSMPDNVATVAPKTMDKALTLPLPSTYRVAGETVEVAKVENKDEDIDGFSGEYAVVTLKMKDKTEKEYVLTADVALENHSYNDKIQSISLNGLAIDLSKNETAGNLKVTYQLWNAESKKLLVALPLSDIELKNVTPSQVTFANIPTAPSVKNLSYCSKVGLTTPTADSAKVGSTSFNVEAQTVICNVQCYPYSDEPKDWTAKNDSKIHNLTVEKDLSTGKWLVKENGKDASEYLEIDGLSVKVKALGWYRFQFQTSTLFGYQLSDDFDTDSVNIEQDSGKTYVRYWSDSVRIYRDSIEPNFAWVGKYEKDVIDVDDWNNKFDELTEYDAYLPMTEKPEATTSQKITVNYDQGLVLPAIFPHDNATAFEDLKVNVYIDRIQNEDGQAVTSNSTENSVWSNEKPTGDKQFSYDMTKPLQIKFVDGNRTQKENLVELSKLDGLYRVRITVDEKQPSFADNTYYSSGYANSKTKYLYFYVDHSYTCDKKGEDENSPKLDANKIFQVSDVYLWEGHTFDFRVPTSSDNHTPAANIQMDYYLVNQSTGTVTELTDVKANASRITVDLDKLAIDLSADTNCYIYAVARNFNAMQNNLKAKAGIINPEVFDETRFEKELLTMDDFKSVDQIAQYGYAWKRAAFTIYATKDSSATATITVTPANNTVNSYKAGEKVVFDTISVNWGSADVDGQMTVAAYLVKDKGARVPVNVVNGDTSSAEIVSSVSFNSNEYVAYNWSFTPGVGGKYILVVTAKDHASSQIQTRVDTINITSSGDWHATPLSLAPAAATNYTIDSTISLGESLVLPNWLVSKDDETSVKYFAKNRNLYAYDTDGNVTVAGDYTVTVLGVNDPNCVIGNKFVPNKTGTYVFQYNFTKDVENNEVEELKTISYVVQVNNDNSGTSSIRMGEDYNDEKLLKNAEEATEETEASKKHTVGNDDDGTFTYVLGSNGTGSDNKPAYAITLKEFTASNYGAATDFVVDSASLFNYLEPIYENNEITGYMYPAIAIPMPNVVTDTTSSDQVEITVQKSGSSTYLVSSKKMNAGGSSSKASVISPMGDSEYYVFRPDGKFDKTRLEKCDENDYLSKAAISTSGAAGVYTVTYKTNNTSVSFNVTFGNLENGHLNWNTGFLTYDNNDGKGAQEITDNGDTTTNVVIEKVDGHRYVTIDMSKIYFDGNEDMKALIERGPDPDHDNAGYNKEELANEYYMKNVVVTVSYEGSTFIEYSDWSEKDDETQAIKNYGDKGEGYKYLYKFDLNQGSGTYKVNISMTNRYTGNTVSKSIEFTIDVDVTNKNTNLNTVWGIILVVLSVGLLAGVIFYFVKTARATRFVDVPNAVKAKKQGKTKAPKTEDKTPKAVEAPKEDVK